MKTIKFFCDVCTKEFPPNSYSFLQGQTVKVDNELNPHAFPFEGHYCGTCTEAILKAIHEIREKLRVEAEKK